jgi:hypothetical protein
VQATQSLHTFTAGPQSQMIGVAENDLRTGGLYLVNAHAFDRTLRPYGHENWRINGASTRFDATQSRA